MTDVDTYIRKIVTMLANGGYCIYYSERPNIDFWRGDSVLTYIGGMPATYVRRVIELKILVRVGPSRCQYTLAGELPQALELIRVQAQLSPS